MNKELAIIIHVLTNNGKFATEMLETYAYILILGLNKFKKRRFHDTVNLLTGQTDAHPDLIKVRHHDGILHRHPQSSTENFW